MLFLDVFFRFSGIGLLLILVVLSWRNERHWPGRPYLILACLSTSALLLGYAPTAIQPPEPLFTAARFADIPHFIFVWLFALSLFEKNFQLRPIHIVVGVVYCAPILWLRLHSAGVLPPLPAWIIAYGSATTALLVGHLCFATLKDRTDDLVHARRAARIYFVIVISVSAVAAAVSELMPVGDGYLDLRTAKMLTLWPAIVWGAVWMLSFDVGAVRFANAASTKKATDPRDQSLQADLEAEMVDREAFRDPALTIVALAARLGVSQHRLRALINQEMGYQNFSAFVNDYRINAVKTALATTENEHLPILTIAMDAGFKSLSPFNKAFRERVGVTPTRFRKSPDSVSDGT